MKNEMINLTDKICVKVQCYNSKDHNNTTKYIELRCGRANNILLGMGKWIDTIIFNGHNLVKIKLRLSKAPLPLVQNRIYIDHWKWNILH